MSAVSLAYILQAQEGFRLDPTASDIAGIVFALACLVLYIVKVYLKAGATPMADQPLKVK